MKPTYSAQYRLKSWSSGGGVPYTAEKYTPICLPVPFSSVYPADGAVYIGSRPHFVGHLFSNLSPV